MSAVSSILVVGAGQTSAVAVATLRDSGYEGRITVVGDEAHAPYERPPLSKAVLAAVNAEEPNISIKERDFFSDQNIDLRLGTRVLALDTHTRTAHLSDGSSVVYDRCLLATGGKARRLRNLPEEANQVHYLRTLDDARRLRTALQQARNALIVGGGFLGLETASTACDMGVKVAVIDTAPLLMARSVPSAFSKWLQARIETTGTQLYLGTSIANVQLPGNAVHIALDDGTNLEADLVVVAVGLTPNTELARDSGLKLNPLNGGIEVDAYCRSSVDDIFAAGDCTSQRDADQNAFRLESWQNANEQARVAAHSMLGIETRPPAYPWFWTDQFNCNVQILGLPQPGLDYVIRGDMDPAASMPKFIMLGLRNSIPHHALAVNAGGDLRALRPLLEKRIPIDPAGFCDTSVSVKAYSKALLTSVAN